MRSKSVLASLAPQTIQMLYLQNFFCDMVPMDAKGVKKKIFFLPIMPRKHLLLPRRDLVSTKEILTNEHLA